MGRMMCMKVKWKAQPEEHDYPAAGAYLLLLADAATTDLLVKRLEEGDITFQKAKDILRASGLPLLPIENPHVKSDLAKIAKEEKLSPILLVRGSLRDGLPLQIADGYHRVCASYHTDENTDIPVKLAAWE